MLSILQRIGNIGSQNAGCLKPRVYFSVSSEGYGHSTRALALARNFEPEELLIGSYGYAMNRIQSFGPVIGPLSGRQTGTLTLPRMSSTT